MGVTLLMRRKNNIESSRRITNIFCNNVIDYIQMMTYLKKVNLFLTTT